MTDDLYEKREQTRVKHYILRHYLERFAHIVGSYWESITYVDGFAGPWNVRSPELKDSSFSIALEELRKARETLSRRGRSLQLQCFFLEKNYEAFLKLKAFADQVQDARVMVGNGSFEESIGSIRQFIKARGRTFPFIFIDPTGWTGFACKLISPLLKLNPGEVLINFMTGHIRRFLTDEASRESFAELFGSPDVRDRILGLSGQDRDDALVSEYANTLRREGGFSYVHSAIVLQPAIDRPNFYLIYATRHSRGVQVFKEAEKLAMREMEKLRAGAQQRKREERTGQGELFQAMETSKESPYYAHLRDRYLDKAQGAVLDRLKRLKRVPYDDVWALALESPLVWESDLKDWVKGWRSSGALRIEGLQGRQQVPSQGESHTLIWRA